MVSIDARLDRPATIVALSAASFAAVATAMRATYATPFVILGAAGLMAGVLWRRRELLGPATGLGLAAVLAHAAIGGGSVGSVAAAALLLVAWDQADNARELDAQLGPDAPVARGELAHAAYSLGVAVLAGGGATVIAFAAAGRRPLPALVLLLLGALLLVVALRER